MLALEKPAGGTATDLEAPLQRIVEIVRKRGLMLLLSDLLAPIEALEKNLGRLTAAGHEVMQFHLLDPAELHLRFEQAALFLDVETGREIYLDPHMARADYRRKLEAHTAAAAPRAKLGIGIIISPPTGHRTGVVRFPARAHAAPGKTQINSKFKVQSSWNSKNPSSNAKTPGTSSPPQTAAA
jgi:hypothetical protein